METIEQVRRMSSFLPTDTCERASNNDALVTNCRGGSFISSLLSLEGNFVIANPKWTCEIVPPAKVYAFWPELFCSLFPLGSVDSSSVFWFSDVLK